MARRVHSEHENTANDLSDVAARRGRLALRHVRHDKFGIVERKLVERDVPHVRIHVEPQVPFVGFVILAGRMVGKLLLKLTVGPLLCKVCERRDLRQRFDGARTDRFDGSQKGAPGSSGSGVRPDLEHLENFVRVLSAAKPRCHLAQGSRSLVGNRLGGARLEHKVAALAPADRDSRREPVCEMA
jgi:hypothetical protein